MHCIACKHLTDRAPNPLGRGECKHKPDAWGCDKACKLFTPQLGNSELDTIPDRVEPLD